MSDLRAQSVTELAVRLSSQPSTSGSSLLQHRSRPRLHIKGRSAPNFGGHGGGRQVLEELIHPAVHLREEADAVLELLREEGGHDGEDDPGDVRVMSE